MDKSECFYDGCGAIKKQAMSVANQCTIKETVREETMGCEFALLFLWSHFWWILEREGVRCADVVTQGW
jgi:hypothetical protein